MGDASDNIPGVPGIGEKTATRLVQEFGMIENLLKNLICVTAKKLQENLGKTRNWLFCLRSWPQLSATIRLLFKERQLSFPA